MAKRFCDLGVKMPEDRKVFNCPQVSITDILNTEIEVIDYLPDVKTKHGEGRYLVNFRYTETGAEAKFFTAASNIKFALDQVDKDDFPFITTIKAVKCGTGKIYQFT